VGRVGLEPTTLGLKVRAERHVGDADEFGPRTLANHPFNKNQRIAEALAPNSWQAQGLNTQWVLYGYALCASG
jgi:hypothetical protein